MAAFVCAVGLIATSACREDQPPEAFNRNLGTADQPLLPTMTPSLDDSILKGNAQIVPLSEVPAEGEAAAADAPFDEDAERAAIAEVIVAAVEAEEQDDFEAAVAVLVERHRPLMEASRDALEKMDELTDALKETLKKLDPRTPAQDALLTSLLSEEGFPVSADDVSFKSPTSASAEFKRGVIGFEKTDEGWLIVMPLPTEDPAVFSQAMTAAVGAYEALAKLVTDDATPLAQRDAQLTAMLQMMGVTVESADSGDGD
jgi:hypothetical protein